MSPRIMVNFQFISSADFLASHRLDDSDANGLVGVLIYPPDVPLPGELSALIISSLSSHIDAGAEWLLSVYRALVHVKGEGSTLLTSAGLIGWDYIAWSAARMGLRMCLVMPPAAPHKAANSILITIDQLDINPEAACFITPILKSNISKKDRLHFRDWLIEKLARKIYPTAIRPGGYWEARLSGASNVDPEFRSSYPPVNRRIQRNNRPSDLALSFPWNRYGVHLTRGVYGSWPGERRCDYFAALKLRKEGNPRDEFETLSYILSSGILRGSGRVIREGVPVVSFSSATPFELLAAKSSSRGGTRAGLQPFGLAIPLDLLADLGGREVIYGQSDEFRSLHPTDRALFQSKGGGRQHASKIDWSREREIRLVGDLDLASIIEHVIALTPDLETGRRLSERSDIKIVHLFEENR